jgi:hypothetical protein
MKLSAGTTGSAEIDGSGGTEGDSDGLGNGDTACADTETDGPFDELITGSSDESPDSARDKLMADPVAVQPQTTITASNTPTNMKIFLILGDT